MKKKYIILAILLILLSAWGYWFFKDFKSSNHSYPSDSSSDNSWVYFM